MARVPASPSLSPGRHLFRAVPQSPALTFRAPTSVLSQASSLAARHTKSASDLNQTSRYEPSRISGATPSSRPSRGASPPPQISPREVSSRESVPLYGTHASNRPYTPSAPFSSTWGVSGMRPASPSSASAPPPRQKQSTGSTWPSSGRVSSAERRSPQWTANASIMGKSNEGGPLIKPSSHVAPVGPFGPSSSPRSSVLAGSTSRSWSQSSQGPRPSSGHLLGQPASALQAVSIDKDARAYSPSSSISTQRAPSQPYLQAGVVSNGPTLKLSGALPDVQYEAQMSNLRSSLMQHIQSVQKEITRLQEERQSSQAGPTQASERRSISNGHVESGMPRANIVPLVSPRASPRTVSVERIRSGTYLQAANHGPVMSQAPSGAGSKIYAAPQEELPNRGLGVRLPSPDVMQAAATRLQRWWRRKVAGRRKINGVSPLLHLLPQSRVVTNGVQLQRRSLDGQKVASGREYLSARQWRALIAARTGRPFVAVHHAACRIQRAWMVSRWRRKFIEFSEREVGWVGTLDWLQQQNLLYGTELAESDDVRWWMLQRQGAPLDHEVDPWGCTKLRDHLNKMWYGRSSEDAAAEEAHARAQAEFLEVQYLKEQYRQAAEREREQRYSEARYSDKGYMVYDAGSNGRESGLMLSHGRAAPAVGVDAHGRSFSQGMAAPNLRSPATTERALDMRANNIATAIGGAVGSSLPANVMKATSLSPRRASTIWSSPDGDMTSRTSRSQVLGAPPPAVHGGLQASPPQTFRAARSSNGPVPGNSQSQLPTTRLTASPVEPSSNVGSSLRPRSPVSAQQVASGPVQMQGRLSLNGNTSARQSAPLQRQPPGLGRAMSGGSPPPSLVARVSGSGSQIAMASLSARR